MKPTREPPPATLVRRKVGARTAMHILPGEAVASTPEDAQYFQNDAEYSKTLRAWLVAYGVGGPVLFLTNKELTQALSDSPEKRLIIALFLIGVSSQVILAFINKWCAWYVYAGEYDRSYKNRRAYKLWAWVNEQSGIDLAIDAISLSAFAYSTWLTLQVFV